jgi:hypothetical protein
MSSMKLGEQINPRRFHAANKCWELLGGNEDNYLWAYNHEEFGVPAVTSLFVPTDEQRKLIAEGHNIALTVLGHQPPVMINISNEPLGRDDRDYQEESSNDQD